MSAVSVGHKTDMVVCELHLWNCRSNVAKIQDRQNSKGNGWRQSLFQKRWCPSRSTHSVRQGRDWNDAHQKKTKNDCTNILMCKQPSYSTHRRRCMRPNSRHPTDDVIALKMKKDRSTRKTKTMVIGKETQRFKTELKGRVFVTSKSL